MVAAMADQMQVIQNKQTRGQILSLLELTHPTPTPENTLINALISSHHIITPDISKHLDYLEDRGYIELKQAPTYLSTAGSMRYVKLTSRGVDLLEETVQDPGVEI